MSLKKSCGITAPFSHPRTRYHPKNMLPLNQSNVASNLVFWSFFLTLAARTWSFALHIPIPVTDDGVDKPGGRFSFGKPFHIIWDLNDGESGKITIIAEPMVGPTNYTLAKDVDLKDLEVYTSISPPKPWPESDTYFIHAANASNPKQILSSTSNIWIFDDKPATATLVIVSESQTPAANTSQAPSVQVTTTKSTNATSLVTSPAPSITPTLNSISTPTPMSMSTTPSANSSTVLSSSTIATPSDNTITTTSSNTIVNILPTTTPLAATSNPATRRNAIIGGIIGGVAFVLLLMIALLIYCRHREQKNSHLAAIPVVMVPNNQSPPSSKFGVLPANPHVPQWPPVGMAEVPREQHKLQPDIPQWPPIATGAEVRRERRKFQPGSEAPATPVPATPQCEVPDAVNDENSEEDAQRLRSQAEVMNERIAELESQLVRGLDIGRQPPGYVSQRQSVVPL
ncbi:hypothetical protein BDZ94DRAFT_1311085 [Collybia nuda]|uniref:Uncharacterized protein n=1 Tax=Collybia nuda TaxID=64659 RepID=A0A9P5Y228_9AGAR|nr:hypothetical protein BDZ94DRAFT_1311085 [Collybia nuda]